MNILLLIRHFDYGGAENHVCELANELTCSGHKVWLISGKGRQKSRLLPGVNHYSVNFCEWNIISLIRRIHLLIVREKIEVIHAHQRFPIWLAILAAKLSDIPVIATVHGLTRHDLRTDYVRKHISKVIVVSENSYCTQKHLPIFSNKLHYIPNGFTVSETSAPPESHNTAFNLFYVSRLDLRHGYLLLKIIKTVWPRIVEKYPGSAFHIVGEGKGLKKIVEAISCSDYSKWSDTILFEKYVRDVVPHYRNADLVMGVGRVAGESLSLGVPVLSIKYNHLGPILTRENFEELSFSNFVAIKSPPLQPDMLFNILDDFISEPYYYKQEASHLRTIIANRYNIHNTAGKTTEIYREACAEKFKTAIAQNKQVSNQA